MERINATLPDGTKAVLRAISRGRGCTNPNISNEIALAIAKHISDNKHHREQGESILRAQKGGK